MHIRFRKIDGFIKTRNGIRCLVLFDYRWLFDYLFIKTCDRIKYLLSEKSGIKDSSSVKRSDLAHFLKAQGKFIFSFPCTLFLHIFDT